MLPGASIFLQRPAQSCSEPGAAADLCLTFVTSAAQAWILYRRPLPLLFLRDLA